MTGPAPECVALAEGLREMRARTGLSLAALAERTPYSKSSWERYLNGKKPVPRQAVEALCAMAGESAGRLLALWELADAEWSGRARHTRPSAEPPPMSSPTSASALVPAGAVGATGDHRRVRRQGLFIAGVGVAAVAMMAALSLRGHSAAGSPASLASPTLDPAPGCRGKACDGKDPSPMACGIPERVDSLGPPHHTSTGTGVDLRYSEVCAAAWGRIWHSKVGDMIEVSAPGTLPRRVVITDAADTSDYRFTPMIGGPDRTGLQLCFTPAGGTDRECFDS
ncbi:helix-turn-helix domain-containing protein [Streptomyces sp. NBC_00576]|uniref:helix-turn-helix domain-containing protein n=1 Tax=Streptomyces sp. NBC_00576 TaxID=2903665 RepID=UPI002E815D23|nr:helix-turn-helix domain-containing protein [Streptomyces sp. NBC_00576]WUB72186.1 XRE family transcriptional regulator [Streptomyces sp. NBC_00576]